MTREEEIEDSLEFCKDIYIYLEHPSEQKTFRQPYREPVICNSYGIAGEVAGTVERVENRSVTQGREGTGYLYLEAAKLFLCVLFAFLCAKALTTYVIQITTVHGTSMEHTIQEGNRIMVDKIWYQYHHPKRFEVIVFSKDGTVNLIKRVIGLPGETVRIEHGSIYINDEELEEQYGFEPMNTDGVFEVTLGADEYFVLGDNRNGSLDSRYASVGPVDKSEIIGRATLRVFPFHEIKWMSELGGNGV